MKRFLISVVCLVGFQTPANAEDAQIPEKSDLNKFELSLLQGIQNIGGGLAYRLSDDVLIYGNASIPGPDVNGTSRYALGVHHMLAKIFYTRVGAGYAEVEDYDGTNLEAGPGIEFAIGNEWRFKNRFVIGGEWFSTGYFLKDNNKNIGQWIEAPQLRVGVTF